MTRSQVTFGPRSDPARYVGRVTSLNGTQLTARLTLFQDSPLTFSWTPAPADAGTEMLFRLIAGDKVLAYRANDVAGTMTNTATVSGNETDSVPANNSSTAPVVLLEEVPAMSGYALMLLALTLAIAAAIAIRPRG